MLTGAKIHAGHPNYKHRNIQIRDVQISNIFKPKHFSLTIHNQFLFNKDIALLQVNYSNFKYILFLYTKKTSEPFQFNDHVGPIGLFRGSIEEIKFQKARIAGWGLTEGIFLKN